MDEAKRVLRTLEARTKKIREDTQNLRESLKTWEAADLVPSILLRSGVVDPWGLSMIRAKARTDIKKMSKILEEMKEVENWLNLKIQNLNLKTKEEKKKLKWLGFNF